MNKMTGAGLRELDWREIDLVSGGISAQNGANAYAALAGAFAVMGMEPAAVFCAVAAAYIYMQE